MKLADRITQCRTPFLVRSTQTHVLTQLDNAADHAEEIGRCATRFVLADELTRLCTALAYSKGARTLDCTDLLHVPAERLWVEWCEAPWQRELERYGFAQSARHSGRGRRGMLIRATRDGRRGMLRTFWSGEATGDVLASNVEAYFDLDTVEGEEPEPPPGEAPSALRVRDDAQDSADVLARCFRFRYERSWEAYYAAFDLSAAERERLWRAALGTIAIDIPVVLAFLLLLATRTGLPQQHIALERLNRVRARSGKHPLLEHIEVRAPLLDGFAAGGAASSGDARRGPRLHHVRGHLVRRGASLFWRMPHLRGHARYGTVRSRTIIWSFARAGGASGRPEPQSTESSSTPELVH